MGFFYYICYMEKNNNIGIVGSRSFNNREVLDSVLSKIMLSEGKPTNVVSGGASGADTLGSDWADDNGVSKLIFEPRYSDFPKKTRRWEAPKARNTTIVENSDVLVAFWDMKSTGTKDSIDKALARGVNTYIYNINNGDLTKVDEEYKENN